LTTEYGFSFLEDYTYGSVSKRNDSPFLLESQHYLYFTTTVHIKKQMMGYGQPYGELSA